MRGCGMWRLCRLAKSLCALVGCVSVAFLILQIWITWRSPTTVQVTTLLKTASIDAYNTASNNQLLVSHHEKLENTALLRRLREVCIAYWYIGGLWNVGQSLVIDDVNIVKLYQT